MIARVKMVKITILTHVAYGQHVINMVNMGAYQNPIEKQVHRTVGQCLLF